MKKISNLYSDLCLSGWILSIAGCILTAKSILFITYFFLGLGFLFIGKNIDDYLIRGKK